MEFYVRHFFEKFPESLLKVFQLFQNRKNYHICTQISPKSLNWWKFGQIVPSNSKKRSIFLKNPLFSKIFGAFGANNLNFRVPKILIFMELGSPPLGRVSPPQKHSEDIRRFTFRIHSKKSNVRSPKKVQFFECHLKYTEGDPPFLFEARGKFHILKCNFWHFCSL